MVTNQNKIAWVLLVILLILGMTFNCSEALVVAPIGLIMLGLKVELSEQIEKLKANQ